MNAIPNAGREVDIAPGPTAQQLSIPLVAVAVGLFAVGVISGGVTYLNRSPVREHHVAGTAALGPHIVLALVAAALLVVVERRRRRSNSHSLLLLAPFGKSAAYRLRYTVRSVFQHPTAAMRLLTAIVPLAMLLYGPWRFGQQVLGGLDPNFTANAWGGPSYLGAMVCHYLDGGLLMAVSAWLLGWLLLRPGQE